MKKTYNLIYLGPEGSYTEIAAENFVKLQNIENFNKDIKNSIIKVTGVEDSPTNEGMLCVKGRFGIKSHIHCNSK